MREAAKWYEVLPARSIWLGIGVLTIDNPFIVLVARFLFVCDEVTRAWSPTGLIPWFSKTEGNTYATLLHHPFLFKGKPTQCSRGSMAPWSFMSFRELLFLHKNNTMAILLKTASVRVSSIQIMQVRVQNKGKRVWKSRYIGDVSTPPSLNLCLSSSNSVDKLKVIKKNFYKLCLILLLQISKASIQVFSKDYELTTFTITLRSHVYSSMA